jgi:hypothetical protein
LGIDAPTKIEIPGLKPTAQMTDDELMRQIQMGFALINAGSTLNTKTSGGGNGNGSGKPN